MPRRQPEFSQLYLQVATTQNWYDENDIKQEKLVTNCGIKAADVLDKLFSQQT